MTDDQKAVFLSIALGCFECVRAFERPGTARHRKLDNVLDHCVKAVDLFNPYGWQGEKMVRATLLLDRINDLIGEMFPGEQGGEVDGRFEGRG